MARRVFTDPGRQNLRIVAPRTAETQMPDAFAAGNSAAAPPPPEAKALPPHPPSRTAPARTCRRARTAAELSLGEDEPGQGAARHFLAEEQQRATRPILRGCGPDHRERRREGLDLRISPSAPGDACRDEARSTLPIAHKPPRSLHCGASGESSHARDPAASGAPPCEASKSVSGGLISALLVDFHELCFSTEVFGLLF